MYDQDEVYTNRESPHLRRDKSDKDKLAEIEKAKTKLDEQEKLKESQKAATEAARQTMIEVL